MQKQNKYYDEYQLLNRYRIGFQTMILFSVLIVINGFIKEFYITWAPPMIEMLILVYIPMFYFVLVSLLKNAYLRKIDIHGATIIMIGLATILNLVAIIQSIMYGRISLIEDGMLSDGIVQVLLLLFFGIIFIFAIIKRTKGRREV